MKKGQKMPLEGRQKLSKSCKGRISPRKGVNLSDKTKDKIRKANIGKKLSKKTKRKMSLSLMGHLPWSRGKKLGKRPKHSEYMKGDGNPNWKGGISFEKYSQDWTDILKESIRKRDNYICQMDGCGIHQDELDGFHKKLDVHHIDYNKNNLDPINLITLCKSCHMKTNFHRNYWFECFNKKVCQINMN